jgi:protein SCO1/2
MATRQGIVGLAAGGIVLLGLAVAATLPRLKQASSGPSIGGAFTLVDGAGHSVSDRDYRGKWRLMYFGYTHCPDACPTTLSDIGAALDKLPEPARKKLVVLFVTVDPERDTPQVVGAYAKAFGPEFVGLTGSQAAITQVEQSFRVYAARHDLKGGDYAMDHSSIIYVMDPEGHFVAVLDDTLKPADLAQHLEQLGVRDS